MPQKNHVRKKKRKERNFYIDKNLRIIDLSLYLEKQGVLSLADFHIGYEEELNKRGFLIPRLQFKETMERLEGIFRQVKPRHIVINGDLKHEFGLISGTEWKHTLEILSYLEKHGKVILIRGNHDTILGPIASKRNIEIRDYELVDGYFFCHGDSLFEKQKGIKEEKAAADFKAARTIIIGHEHPAVTIGDDVRREKYKCFLYGTYRGKKLVVLPSFNLVLEGSDIESEASLSPFVQNARIESVHIVGDKGEIFTLQQGS